MRRRFARPFCVESLETRLQLAADFGDAPNTFGTTLASNGARHDFLTGLYLGTTVDAEADGTPTVNADYDDVSGLTPDDEDGVTAFPTLIAGETANLNVYVTNTNPALPAGPRLSIFFDWNANGQFDDANQVLNRTVVNGNNVVPVAIPSNAVPGATYARFRLAIGNSASPSGPFPSGEVEDYRIEVLPGNDFGDAPDTYGTTLGANGAQHSRVSGLFLGSSVDGEINALASPGADYDDLSGVTPDDEDGVTFSSLTAGETAVVTVAVTKPVDMSALPRLSAWFDWTGSGNFNDVPAIFNASVSPGVNTFNVAVPAHAKVGQTYARFRLSTNTVTQPFGLVNGGEVEDYRVTINPGNDFGDAPNTYLTTLSNNGAWHSRISGLFLGTRVDGETDGTPTVNADYDDLTGTGPDDEDGVTIPTLTAGESSSVSAVVSLPAGMPNARLSAWFDWNRNGFFDDQNSIIGALVTAGSNTITVQVPSNSFPGETYARFRLSNSIVSSPMGQAFGGEVEDYRITVNPGDDLGDAPSTYGTLRAHNGPVHTRVPLLFMGAAVDGELDAAPSVNADGDDLGGLTPDDEDGVTLPATLTQGEAASVGVVVSLPPGFPAGQARLSAWFDWNLNGAFDEPAAIFGVPVTAGTNNLSVQVPANAAIGSTYARFRLGTSTISSPVGFANGGEVEDYRVTVVSGTDFGDAPLSYGTLIAHGGALHSRFSGVYLGERIDGENDGQPSADADGDDLAGVDDDDGIASLSALVPGQAASATVAVHLAPGMPSAFVSAWFDWNRNGAFDEPAAVLNGTVGSGGNVLLFNVPANASLGTTYARFRISPNQIFNPTGFISGGEVEDYKVPITATALPAWVESDGGASWDPLSRTLQVTGAAKIVADPGGDDPDVYVSSDGVLTVDPVSDKVIHVRGLHMLEGGTTVIASLGAARSASNHRVLVTRTLNIDPNSKLDVTDNDVIVDYDASSPIAAVEADVAGGYNVTGDWLGNGITSSVAQLDGNFTVAVADNAQLAGPFGSAQGGPLFAGVDVDLTAVLVKFTHRADVNLDGIITPDDSAVFGGNYDEGSFASWATGDMNFDGLFTPDDAAIFGGVYDESLTAV